MPLLTVCAGQVIKSTMKRVDNNSVDLLTRVLKGSVKFSPTLQKEMEEERGDQE